MYVFLAHVLVSLVRVFGGDTRFLKQTINCEWSLCGPRVSCRHDRHAMPRDPSSHVGGLRTSMTLPNECALKVSLWEGVHCFIYICEL
ncbi:hypothetical protein NPIL_347621 [Nephila pilipes]|uniref:Secreted protein n=1 Tax=Nephila pilipes TaxID=299642 RepID=A0A8X6MEX2_NEPPI|nr:hypothetical protein NPIL_347621 [Nephila pilipes]